MENDEQGRGLQVRVKDAAVDVRNEAIVQTATLYLLARKILLVSLGAMALTAEEAAEFIDKLADRGEIAESDLQKLMKDFRAHSREHEQDLNKVGYEAGAALEESVETLLARLNVPTKTDIEELSAKIAVLNEKVSELNERRQQPE